MPRRARFRVNVFQQRGSVCAVMRLIPWEIKPLEDLGMPSVVETFAHLKRGLVLVTGPTGSGKSTTLAAIIDKVNRTRRGHIMTIEDPIEFLHKHQECLVNQREVGLDTHGFRTALKHVLRQDPDVILVGELRDLDTISVAISAAETGHLVFATLHTQSAQDTITRLVDVFPADQQQQVRTQLSATLQGVVCQTLVKTVDGKGRAAAVEVMVCTPGIRAMIRDDKLQQIQGSLQAGAKDGMQTLNAHLAHLVSSRADQLRGRCGELHQPCGLRDPGLGRPAGRLSARLELTDAEHHSVRLQGQGRQRPLRRGQGRRRLGGSGRREAAGDGLRAPRGAAGQRRAAARGQARPQEADQAQGPGGVRRASSPR